MFILGDAIYLGWVGHKGHKNQWTFQLRPLKARAATRSGNHDIHAESAGPKCKCRVWCTVFGSSPWVAQHRHLGTITETKTKLYEQNCIQVVSLIHLDNLLHSAVSNVGAGEFGQGVVDAAALHFMGPWSVFSSSIHIKNLNSASIQKTIPAQFKKPLCYSN